MENEKTNSNSKLTLFIALAVIAAVLLIASFLGSKEDEKVSSSDQMMKSSEVAISEEATEKQENVAMMDKEVTEPKGSFQGSVLAGTKAPLIEFNQSDYEKALNSDKLIVLYFYANWCPTCKEEFANALKPFFDELERDDVVGFRVSFNDNETSNQEEQLAKEFGVAYQHTKVLLKNKERVLKAPDSWSKERYVQETQKY